jgi:serine/threonine-protein kinase RsbW
VRTNTHQFVSGVSRHKKIQRGHTVAGNESPSRKLNICWSIPSKVKAISPCVDRLMRMITKSKCVPGEEQDVELALREAIGNAVIHGNRENPAKRVHIRCRSRRPGALFIAVRDEGNGFSPKQSEKSALATADSDHGRGILLMRAYMDTVRYSRARSEVYLRKRAREQPAGSVPQTEAPPSTARPENRVPDANSYESGRRLCVEKRPVRATSE